MTVHARPGPDPARARATVIAGRKLGPAVARNRAKRRLRAALRQCGVPAGFDVVAVAGPSVPEAEFSVLATEVERALTRATTGAAGTR